MKLKSRIIVFILSFLVWIALTDLGSLQEIIAGIIIAAIVALMAGHFLVTTEKSEHIFKRIISALVYFFRFLWEMIKANVHVAYIVLHPGLPIKPGIVRIKTDLKKDSSLTVLSNSITLTPGTLSVDISDDKKHLYVHWIDVEESDEDKATSKIGSKFEGRLKEVFE